MDAPKFKEPKMEEVFNFNAGPAVLPKAVMLKAQEELVTTPTMSSSEQATAFRSSLL